MRSIYLPLLDLIGLLKSGRFDLVGFLGGLSGELAGSLEILAEVVNW